MVDSNLREHQFFSQSIELAVRAVNREILHPVVDPLTKDKVIAISIEVAKRRGMYIAATLKMGKTSDDRPTGEELKKLRLEFEEARDGFGALMTAIERDYIDVPSE